MTLIFETKKFRVQIVGKSAWVETSEGCRWVFRSQINLPVNLSTAPAPNGSAVLRSAVKHYERVRNGDQALRAALTGTVVKETQAVSPTTAEAPRQPLQRAQRQGTLNNGGRGPLRPPLVRLEIGLPQRVTAKLSDAGQSLPIQ
jgi:hypothetical protein